VGIETMFGTFGGILRDGPKKKGLAFFKEVPATPVPWTAVSLFFEVRLGLSFPFQ
jgi:hypothetical protein